MSSLNRHNRQYYQTHGTHQIPDLLAAAVPIQETIRRAVETNIPHDPIKVLELGFGSRPHRYNHIAQSSNRRWQVMLTDFSISVLPATLPATPYLFFERRQFNLLTDPWPPESFDVILSTYTFDSIDFPEDKYLDGKHYPGGLIQTVKEARHHLTPHGFFLTIDKWSSEKVASSQPAGGAQFKTLDLTSAAEELSASLIPLPDFMEQYQQRLPINLSDHACLVATKSTPTNLPYHL